MRKLKNFKRRAVAVLMSIMCLTMIVPSGVTALAAPSDDDSYAVTLANGVGGEEYDFTSDGGDGAKVIYKRPAFWVIIAAAAAVVILVLFIRQSSLQGDIDNRFKNATDRDGPSNGGPDDE